MMKSKPKKKPTKKPKKKPAKKPKKSLLDRVIKMAKGVKHYLKNGTEQKGATHKTNGMAMTGARHTSTSKDLFHKKDLSAAVKKRMAK